MTLWKSKKINFFRFLAKISGCKNAPSYGDNFKLSGNVDNYLVYPWEKFQSLNQIPSDRAWYFYFAQKTEKSKKTRFKAVLAASAGPPSKDITFQ